MPIEWAKNFFSINNFFATKKRLTELQATLMLSGSEREQTSHLKFKCLFYKVFRKFVNILFDLFVISFEKLESGLICTTAENLMDLGEAFGEGLGDGDVAALYGDLGVGKTTFVKGIGRALRVTDSVTSPTFSIMAQYSGIMNLVHIDAYRLDGSEYLEVLDYVQSPYVIVVEWPEKLIELRENITHIIRITVQENGNRWVIWRKSNRKTL
jgi:tRNA threonylcarbamoyladenosine biosynthesis protein TsaE